MNGAESKQERTQAFVSQEELRSLWAHIREQEEGIRALGKAFEELRHSNQVIIDNLVGIADVQQILLEVAVSYSPEIKKYVKKALDTMLKRPELRHNTLLQDLVREYQKLMGF